MPGLAGGLFVHRRLRDHAGTRTAGTAVALGGLALMLVGLGLAWPRPLPLFVVALLDGATFTLIALGSRASWLHAWGLSCLALAVLLGAQLVATGWALPMVAALPDGRSSSTPCCDRVVASSAAADAR